MRQAQPTPRQVTLGEYMASLYDELLALYGDPDIAAVATAAMVNDMLAADAVDESASAAA